MNNKEQLKSLTALRFLFFLCVFLSHYMINGHRVLPNGGSFAVVFFFILSGFSLSFGYGDKVGKMDYTSFIKKRFLRLWPMQFATIVVRAIPILIIPIFVGSLEWKNIVSFVLKFFFAEAWIPDAQVVFNFNACAWYLSPLVFCYFIFPFIYNRIMRAGVLRIVFGIIVYLLIYVGCINIIPPERHQVFLYAAPYFRVFDFSIGIVIFRMFESYSIKLSSRGWSGGEYALLGTLVVVAWLPLKDIPAVWRMASIYWAPAIGIIVGGIVLEKSCAIRLLSARWLQSLGAASYEMYMTHLFLVSFFQHLDKRFLSPGDYCLKVFLLIVCLGCSVFAGVAVRRWFNIPISNYMRNRIM